MSAILAAVVFSLLAAISGNAQFSITEQAPAAIDPLLAAPRGRLSNPPMPANDAFALKALIARTENSSAPSSGALDPSFSADVDSFPGTVRSTARQTDGKILVGGYFKNINGAAYKNIFRLNADYSIDPSFNAKTNGTVFSIALQADGKIVIGGSFTVVNGTVQNRIARLNSDGSLDASFNTGFGTDNVVYEVAVQPDGKIVLGGSFVYVGNGISYYVARLNADGARDATFSSPIPPSAPFAPPSIVYAIALQPDGKIILGGYIVLDGINFPTVATPVARLNTDGSFDSSFNPGTINSNLYDVAVQPDGKILIAGFFTQINGAARRYLARLSADGTLDASFDASIEATAPVWTMHLQTDGKILFSSIVIIPSNGVVKQLNPDGSLHRTFNPAQTVTGQIYTILTTAGGKVLTGGSFSSLSGGNPNTALLFNADGSPDTGFSLSSKALGGVRALAAQPDGKVIIGGNFNRVNGVGKNRLARLNPDGSLDTAFNPTATFTSSAPRVTALLLQADGKILVGGSGLIANGNSSGMVMRLKSDGTLDETFTAAIPAARATVNALAVQPDGKILVAYSGQTPTGGTNSGLSRLNPDGSLDATFTGLALQYEALVVLPDGKILAGGPTGIAYVNGGTGESDSYYGVVRLNADGSHDRNFRTEFTSFENGGFTSVYALALQPDGRILVGGSLVTRGAATSYGVVRLHASGTIDGTFERQSIFSSSEAARVEDLFLLPDGKVLAGGFFDGLGVSPQKNVARLNANGVIDATFQAKTDNAVYDIEFQSAGKLLIGGDFETVNDVSRTSVARLINEVMIVRPAPFDFDGDGKTDLSVFRPSSGEWWINRSATAQTVAAQFGAATDKLVPADYTGDGKTDIAFFRPSTGEWFILRSENGSFLSFPFGAAGDIPAPGDFDADGKADPTVYRPSTNEWFILKSTGGTQITTFGAAGDVPVAADYDGDGKTDVAVFRPADGSWWYVRSADNQFRVFSFGLGTDRPVPGDWTGDGKADIAVFRPATGEWFFQRSEDNSYFSVPFGAPGDIPAPGDYDGDGRFDTAVFRPSAANWFVQRSTDGLLITAFGAAGDQPLPGVFIH